MEGLIFLLTKNEETQDIVKASIKGEYEIAEVSKSTLMMELYKKNPAMLIVDIDSYGEQIIDFIQNIISIEYIPVLYIHNDDSSVIELLKNEMLLPLDKIDKSILWIIKQSILFKSRYDKVLEGYNAIDLLNGTVKGLLQKYVGMKKGNNMKIIEDLLNIVYAQNIFLSNKPNLVWVFSIKSELCNANSLNSLKINTLRRLVRFLIRRMTLNSMFMHRMDLVKILM